MILRFTILLAFVFVSVGVHSCFLPAPSPIQQINASRPINLVVISKPNETIGSETAQRLLAGGFLSDKVAIVADAAVVELIQRLVRDSGRSPAVSVSYHAYTDQPSAPGQVTGLPVLVESSRLTQFGTIVREGTIVPIPARTVKVTHGPLSGCNAVVEFLCPAEPLTVPELNTGN